MGNSKIEIKGKIKSYKIVDSSEVPTNEPAIIEVQAPLKDRPAYLHGTTYKVEIPSKDSMYVTINNDDEGNIFEIFINSRDVEHFQWITAITRTLSAVFRRENDIHFLVKELKSVVDPNGGYYKKGKYVPSIVYEIGSVIELHLALNDFVEPEEVKPTESTPEIKEEPTKQIRGTKCPSCGEFSFVREGGCEKCFDCGFMGKCEG